MSDEYNKIPDIHICYDDQHNPTLRSPNTPFELPFRHTRDTFMDVDEYKYFIENCISRFRHSKTYKNYKKYLYDIGLDHCQILGNISKEEATVEMHHNFLNIFDITLMITEHFINTKGSVSTFQVVQALKDEHKQNNIPIVMLSKTPHQLYHNSNGDLILPARMCFGYWYNLLKKYNRGITIDIATKVIKFLKISMEFENNYVPEDNKSNYLLAVRDDVKGWSQYNDYADHMRIAGVVY